MISLSTKMFDLQKTTDLLNFQLDVDSALFIAGCFV